MNSNVASSSIEPDSSEKSEMVWGTGPRLLPGSTTAKGKISARSDVTI